MSDQHKEEFEAYRTERNRIMREMDVAAAQKMFPQMDPESVEVMLHKARYEVVEMGPELRQASRAWLELRGYSRMKMQPWPPAGVLPKY